jgi:hypothetical protein
MKVKELKKMLEKYPDEMKVLNGRRSDYEIISESEWNVVKGVEKSGWVMRSHQTMSDENKAAECDFLLLEGN